MSTRINGIEIADCLEYLHRNYPNFMQNPFIDRLDFSDFTRWVNVDELPDFIDNPGVKDLACLLLETIEQVVDLMEERSYKAFINSSVYRELSNH